MTKFAILVGSAPEDFRQKKIEDMFDFLDSKRNSGDSIVTFANGISEMMLEMVLGNSVRQLKVDSGQITESSEQKAGRSTTQKCHSATQSCHSELVSESVKETLKQVQGDNGMQVQHDGFRKSNSVLLYICTLQPVSDGEKSFWLGGEEIRRDVILHYQEVAAECGIDMQVVFDSDSEMVSEEKLGWEDVEDCEDTPCNDSFSHFATQKCHSELDSESTYKQPLKQVQHDGHLRN